MDKLSDNNIPSDSNDKRLESDNSDTETNELDQLRTIYCIAPLIAWCAQKCTYFVYPNYVMFSFFYCRVELLYHDTK